MRGEVEIRGLKGESIIRSKYTLTIIHCNELRNFENTELMFIFGIELPKVDTTFILSGQVCLILILGYV